MQNGQKPVEGDKARQMLQAFLVAHRTARTHSVGNDAMVAPVQGLLQHINGVIQSNGACDFYLSGTVCIVNGVVTAPELQQLQNVRDVSQEMRQRDIGGFRVPNRIDIDTVQHIISSITQGSIDHAQAGFELVRARPVESMLRQIRGAEVTHLATRDPVERALQILAALMAVVEKTIAEVQAGRPPERSQMMSHVLRELIDACAHVPQVMLMTGLLRDDQLDYRTRHLASSAIMSVLVGIEFNMPRSALFQVAQVALLHEVAVAVYGAHLETAGRELSPVDRQLVRDLPYLSARIFFRRNLFDDDTLGAVLGVVEARRPHDDPLGLSARMGDGMSPQTMLLARIVQACAAFDALTSHRPYREAMTIPTALDHIARGQPKLDPVVMLALTAIIDDPARLLGRSIPRATSPTRDGAAGWRQH